MSIAHNREEGGRLVREAWVHWAKKQPNPQPTWLTPWEVLDEQDKEADRCIWDDIVAPYTAMINKLVEENAQFRKDIDKLEDDKDHLVDRIYNLLDSE